MHKRTKATSISKKVAMAVYERDDGKCIICGSPGIPRCHIVRRSQGGLGIEENIITLCDKHHRGFDSYVNREWYDNIINNYMNSHYENWNRAKLVYRKGQE